VQTLLGHIERWLAYSQAPLEDCAGEKEMNGLAQSDKPVGTKKCTTCGEVKSLTDYYEEKRWKIPRSACKDCFYKKATEYVNVERGYLNVKYQMMTRKRTNLEKRRTNKCFFTFDELLAAWEKHKSIYGRKSAWGPGPDHLEQHLPVTMVLPRNSDKKAKRIRSNLSIDRLDNNLDYTIQNIIFIRGDENVRKRDTTYEDCKIQIRLYEERFKNEME